MRLRAATQRLDPEALSTPTTDHDMQPDDGTIRIGDLFLHDLIFCVYIPDIAANGGELANDIVRDEMKAPLPPVEFSVMELMEFRKKSKMYKLSDKKRTRTGGLITPQGQTLVPFKLGFQDQLRARVARNAITTFLLTHRSLACTSLVDFHRQFVLWLRAHKDVDFAEQFYRPAMMKTTATRSVPRTSVFEIKKEHVVTTTPSELRRLAVESVRNLPTAFANDLLPVLRDLRYGNVDGSQITMTTRFAYVTTCSI